MSESAGFLQQESQAASSSQPVPPEGQNPLQATPAPTQCTTLCGARISVRKNSQKYSVWQPATIGGIILLDGHPYALTTAKVFLPPQARPARGVCYYKRDQEHDYVLQEHLTAERHWNSEDELGDDGRPRRNCEAVDEDAEFVVSFMDEGLRRLNRVVRPVERQPKHQQDGGEGKSKAGNWKAAYVNLDYGWALVDMADVSSHSLLVNEIYHHDDQDNGDHTNMTITCTKSLPAYGPPEPISDGRLCVCTHIHSPQGTRCDGGYDYMYLAGTNKQSWKNVLVLNYAYHVGDNGSWVVDWETGHWWGIVVNEDRGESYAIPAQMVLENIRKAMGAKEVTLPQPPKPETKGNKTQGTDQDGEEIESENEDGSGREGSERPLTQGQGRVRIGLAAVQYTIVS